MRKLFEHPLVILLVTIIAGTFLFSLYVSARGGNAGAKTLASLDQTIALQQQRVTSLEQQVALSSDPFVQEKIQRDERLQQQPGEIVLQLPPIILPTPVPESTAPSITPWDEWKELLFHWAVK